MRIRFTRESSRHELETRATAESLGPCSSALLLMCMWVVCTCAPVYGATGGGAGAANPAANSGAQAHTALGDAPVRSFSEKSNKPSGEVAGTPTPTMDYSRVLGALAAVLGLIFLLRWCGRFFFPSTGGRHSSRAVEVIARSPLSPKQQIMLIRVGRRLIVVGDSGSQMNPLCELSDPDEVAALVGQLHDDKLAPAKKAFGAMFGRSRSRFDSTDSADPAQSLVDEAGDAEPVVTAREELSGLRERVRVLAQQFKGT